jgi:hypothetical protein
MAQGRGKSVTTCSPGGVKPFLRLRFIHSIHGSERTTLAPVV